ncbi:MAG: fasciclin domain-containing protein, partial [Pseudomonadota bacterium]
AGYAQAGYDKDKMAHKATKMNIVEKASSKDDFSTLVTAVKQAELVEALSSEGPFTVFAPTNAAFEKVPGETLASLLKDENKADLQSLLQFHVVKGKIKADDIAMGTTEVETLQGDKIEIIKNEDGVTVDGAKVIMADVKTSNGVIHAIDTVAMP